MKLYQTYTSPFPTRVRLLLYAKGIEAEIIEPPGFHSSAEAKGDYLTINPIGRVPTPEDIVPLVLLLSSPLAGAMTGQAMAVDGGMGLAVQY